MDKTKAHWQGQTTLCASLYQRLSRFEQENISNPDPVDAEFRLDAGFGTYTNVALLIEMGYEVYTKPYGQQVVTALRQKVDQQTNWARVGANAELVAWGDMELKNSLYPLDVALERFHTGKTIKHSALFHYGDDPVTEDLPAWFQRYNGRQTIEAGIKACPELVEGKANRFSTCITSKCAPNRLFSCRNALCYLQQTSFAGRAIGWLNQPRQRRMP